MRIAAAKQLAPVLRVHAEVERAYLPIVARDEARHRIAHDLVAYDAMRVIRTCGDLRSGFSRVLDALRDAGVASNADCRAILQADVDVDDLVVGWLTGDRAPRNPRRNVARQAAILVGNAILRSARDLVGPPAAWRLWSRAICPCCGGSPDMAFIGPAGSRTMVCARCDAQWRAPRAGCLGCTASPSTAIARISNRALSYDLVMCSSCGRFLKERRRRGAAAFLVERALTAELDTAAEQRGLRL